ncbi:hypothetical protein A1I_04745 [Rickettsia bellii OSU 85-389]|nr:hypothetical protein A1I_04745 [Rickettsia bellii OSU 85-389]
MIIYFLFIKINLITNKIPKKLIYKKGGMKKKLYKAVDVKSNYDNDNIEIIKDIRKIENQSENEWFVVVHRSEYFPPRRSKINHK